jgi:hypothetical protein
MREQIFLESKHVILHKLLKRIYLLSHFVKYLYCQQIVKIFETEQHIETIQI